MPDPREGDKKYLKGRQGIGQNSAVPLVAKAQAIQALGDTAMPTFVGSNSDHHLATALKYLGRGAEDSSRYAMAKFKEDDIDREALAKAAAREDLAMTPNQYSRKVNEGAPLTKGQYRGIMNVRGEQAGQKMSAELIAKYNSGATPQELNLEYARLVAEAELEGEDADFLNPLMQHLDNTVDRLYKKDSAKREATTKVNARSEFAVGVSELVATAKEQGGDVLTVAAMHEMQKAIIPNDNVPPDAQKSIIIGALIERSENDSKQLEDVKKYMDQSGLLNQPNALQNINKAIYEAKRMETFYITKSEREAARATKIREAEEIQAVKDLMIGDEALSPAETAVQVQLLPDDHAGKIWYEENFTNDTRSGINEARKREILASWQDLSGYENRNPVELRKQLRERYGISALGDWAVKAVNGLMDEPTAEELSLQNGLITYNKMFQVGPQGKGLGKEVQTLINKDILDPTNLRDLVGKSLPEAWGALHEKVTGTPLENPDLYKLNVVTASLIGANTFDDVKADGSMTPVIDRQRKQANLLASGKGVEGVTNLVTYLDNQVLRGSVVPKAEFLAMTKMMRSQGIKIGALNTEDVGLEGRPVSEYEQYYMICASEGMDRSQMIEAFYFTFNNKKE